MADVAFLLLIFFLVTTTFPKDKGLAVVLPEPGQEAQVSQKHILHLIVQPNGIVDPAADLTDDALTNVQKLGIVAKPDVRFLDLAIHFNEGRIGTVDHDVGDVVARQERLKRAVTQDVVTNVIEQFLLLGD